jgi:putative ABC transport system permease protein
MALLRRITAGFRGLLLRTRVERELDAELREFLAISIEQKVRTGMSREAATRAARLELGSTDAIKDRVRDVGWESAIERSWRDVRYAVRSLRRAPVFTAVTILTLALGIGASTAIFELADAVRLRPLPVEHPEQLVEVRMADPARGRWGTFAGRRPLFTNALWEELRRRQQAFSGLLAWSAYPVNLSARGEAQFAQGLWVSGDFFNVLGVQPHLGRLLASSDDRPGCAAPAAVLAYAFWQRQYGGDPSVIGRTVTLDGHPFEIVGVTPRRFVGLEVGRTFDLATPICAERILNPEQSALNDRGWWWLTVMARLAPAWSVERASGHLAALSPGIFRSTVAAGLPPDVTDAYVASTLRAFPAPAGVSGTVREEYETPLWVLLAIAGVVLMIASANIATLLLARATARERDTVVRLALGASRGRLIRQLLTESALIAAVAACAGVFLAQTLSDGLVGLLHSTGFQFFGIAFNLDPNWRVLLFAVTIAVATCLLFGLAPAVLATRPSAGTLLRASGRASTDPRSRDGARSVLVVAQVALSFVLAVMALLFVRTLHNLAAVDSGFDLNRVGIVVIDYQRAKVPAERRLELQTRLLDGVRSVPGVQSVASARMVPLTGESWQGHVVIDGVQQQNQIYFNRVSPAFFQTMGTAFITGRDFTPDDSLNSRRVAIVNESFARRVLGGRNPIGSTFQMPASPGAKPPTFEIVGLVKDTKYTSLREPFEPIAFLAASQERRPFEYVNLVVRTTSASLAVTRSLTAAVTRTEPEAVVLVQPFQAQIASAIVRERLTATLAGFFGVVAAFLAMLGLYGIVAYGVIQRTREIGIRMALGAQRAEVLALVLRQSTVLAGIGVVLGLGAAAVASRYVKSMLFGLSPLDPTTFIAVAVAFAMVAALAAYMPARRAANVDPLIALRCE